MVLHRKRDRGCKCLAEIVLERAPARCVALVPEHAGDVGSIGDPEQDEEIVPVRVHGLGGVALVADRFGDEPVEHVLGRARVVVGRAQALGAERFDVAHGEADVVVLRFEECFGAGLEVVVPEDVDVLARGVVLVDGVGAAVVDDAGGLAVLEEVARIPGDEALDVLVEPGGEEGVARERAVTDPCALVGARARPDGGPVLVDECVGDRRADGIFEVPLGFGQMEPEIPEHFVPFCLRVDKIEVEALALIA